MKTPCFLKKKCYYLTINKIERYFMNQEERIKKYIKKKYYKDDRKVITLHIKDELELYNHLDSAKDTISSDVTNYLERSMETLIPLNKIEIKIDCPKKVDLKNFERCLKIHYGIENFNYDRVEKLKRKKETFLLTAGLITLSTFLFMHSLYEVRYFIATLAIWEYIDMKIYTDEEDEIKKYIFELLDDATVSK